jgi:hypothetical protein
MEIITEQILRSKGWKKKWGYSNQSTFEKGDVWQLNGKGAYLNLDEDKKTITIEVTGDSADPNGPKLIQKYQGKCPDGKTYDFICDLIDFKL